MNDKIIGKRFLLIIIILFVIGILYRVSGDFYREKVLEYSNTAYGNVLSFGASMGSHYIFYEFEVEGMIYNGRSSIKKSEVDTGIVNNYDLKLKYAVDDPEVSEIIDDRFE